MAGDWIKWTKGLADKREVVLIASRLKRDRFEVAGRMMRLWEWCDENIPNQDIDQETGDAVVELGDEPLPFLSALCGLPGLAEMMASPEIRWISTRSRGRLIFPNLGRHNGTTAKSRAVESKKKRRQRDKSPETCPGNTGTKTGLEKRREDKEQELGATGVPPAAPRRQQAVPVQDIVDAYNSTLTRLAKVRSLTPKRRRAVETLWRSSPLAGDVDLFRQYFEECEADPFLNGAGPYRNGHENWRPDFDYLLRPDVVTKTYERALDAIERETRQ